MKYHIQIKRNLCASKNIFKVRWCLLFVKAYELKIILRQEKGKLLLFSSHNTPQWRRLSPKRTEAVSFWSLNSRVIVMCRAALCEQCVVVRHRVRLCITKMYLKSQVKRCMDYFSILAFPRLSLERCVNINCDLIFYFYRKWFDLVFYYASYWKLIKILKLQHWYIFLSMSVWYFTPNTQSCYLGTVKQHLISRL